MIKKLFFLTVPCFLFSISGCVTISPPLEDYTLARTAIESAKAVDAARYSSGFMHKAELSYKKAQQHYEDREFAEAITEFRRAKDSAEKAENSARYIRFKNGEVL